ncbi:hypothetical protein GCM10009768_20930 [Leucobacter iarius]|uniref:Uncharacterized protein n=1 Tax=Leucobacter iarius TaxID=333963 RepID=A0ABP4XQS8_9MICO
MPAEVHDGDAVPGVREQRDEVAERGAILAHPGDAQHQRAAPADLDGDASVGSLDFDERSIHVTKHNTQLRGVAMRSVGAGARRRVP